MIYLHEKQINDRLIKHWANESESLIDETPTYKIRQIETGIFYDEAIDPVELHRQYIETDIPIEEIEEPIEGELESVG